MSELSLFQQKLKEKRDREAALAREAELAVKLEEDKLSAYAEHVPEVEEAYVVSDAEKELDRVVDSIDILDAYRRWCGKMEPKVRRGQKESIMISCPNPAHPDKEPSAWINLEKQTWFCGGCQQGGDAHDIAAWRFGYPVPSYKTDSRFHQLRKDMAADFGYRIETYPGDVKILVSPNDIVEDIKEQEEEEEKPALEIVNNVIDLYSEDDEVIFPALDWRSICPVGSFLFEYMKACTIDDVPEEYHFWNGLIAIGFAGGRDVKLWDSNPVFSNLFVCTLGTSGSGKSKARSHLARLLLKALPHDWTDPSSNGVEIISAVGSAESLVQSFQKDVALDPTNPKSPTMLMPVRGLIDFNELSALISRTNRSGSGLKPALMQFYDGEPNISTRSLTTGKKEAREPFGSALTTTQPLALKALIGRTDDDSGFLNRWVFVGGPDKKKVAIGGARVDIDPCVMPLKKIAGWSGSFREGEFVQWSEGAAESFTEFFHSVIEPDKKKAASALLTRIDLLMKKLILLLSMNKLEKVVSPTTVMEAISCYEYIKACYGVPEAQIGNTLQNEISDAIMYQARKQYDIDKRGISMNQLAKSLKRKKYPNDLLIKTLESLVKLEYLQVVQSEQGKPGRPTVRYRYVDVG